MIQKSQTEMAIIQTSDNRGETNLRREKQISEREKVELDMKKWKKDQSKVEYIIFVKF